MVKEKSSSSSKSKKSSKPTQNVVKGSVPGVKKVKSKDISMDDGDYVDFDDYDGDISFTEDEEEFTDIEYSGGEYSGSERSDSCSDGSGSNDGSYDEKRGVKGEDLSSRGSESDGIYANADLYIRSGNTGKKTTRSQSPSPPGSHGTKVGKLVTDKFIAALSSLDVGNSISKAFTDLDYSTIIKLSLERTLKERLELRDFLSKKKTDVLRCLSRETSFLLRTTFMGLYSEEEVYDTLMIRNAIKSQDINEIARILVLKTNEAIENIKEHYQGIFSTSLEEDLDKFPEGPVFKRMLTLRRYYAVVSPESFDSEVHRLIEMIKEIKTEALSIFTLCFTQSSFKGMAVAFYDKYGSTICEYIDQSQISKRVCGILRIAHDAAFSPECFYASILHDAIRTNIASVYLPFYLISSNMTSLSSIMKRYHELYGEDLKERLGTAYQVNMKELLSGLIEKQS